MVFVFVTTSHPLLPIAVLQVVDVAIIPLEADAEQGPREEAVLDQNYKVSEEATESLDHPCKQKMSQLRQELQACNCRVIFLTALL